MLQGYKQAVRWVHKGILCTTSFSAYNQAHRCPARRAAASQAADLTC